MDYLDIQKNSICDIGVEVMSLKEVKNSQRFIQQKARGLGLSNGAF